MKIIGNFPTLLRSSKRASPMRRKRLRLLFIILWYGSTIGFIVLHREEIINLLDYNDFTLSQVYFLCGQQNITENDILLRREVFAWSLCACIWRIFCLPTKTQYYNLFLKLIISIIVNKFITNRKCPDLYQIVKGRNTMTIFGN